jgi:hypothetical protein
MPRNLIPKNPGGAEAADLMVRYDLSLREAAAELGTDLTIDQADAILKRKLFQKTLEEAKTAYYTELGSDPKLTKETVVWQLYRLAMRLAEDREDLFKGTPLPAETPESDAQARGRAGGLKGGIGQSRYPVRKTEKADRQESR